MHNLQALSHTGELHYYVQPLVIEEVPGSMSVGDLVGKLNSGEAVKGVTPVTLDSEAAAFLSSDDTLLLLLGEAGSGKSMFSWLTVQKCVHAFDAVANGVQTPPDGDAGSGSGSGSEVPATLWVPVVIDLKQYRMSEVVGRLPKYVRDVCGTSDADLSALRNSSPSVSTLPRLSVVVICDGFDELQAEESEAATKSVRAGLRDLFNLVTDPARAGVWAAGSLKIVVTTRESRLNGRGDENAVFGKHRRRVLLPFNDTQVQRLEVQ